MKLVDKIRAGKFVEMKELLQDNISLVAQLEELQGPSSLQLIGASRPRLCEVSSLATWCYCFLGYAATMKSTSICPLDYQAGPEPGRAILLRIRPSFLPTDGNRPLHALEHPKLKFVGIHYTWSSLN